MSVTLTPEILEKIRADQWFELDLSHNPLSDEDAAKLGEAIKHNTSLQRLDLEETELSDKGMASICDGLKENHSIRVLMTHRNAYGKAGLDALLGALEQNHGLCNIYINSDAVTSDDRQDFYDKVPLTGHQNLGTLVVSVMTSTAYKHCEANRNISFQLGMKMRDKEIGDIPIATLCTAGARFNQVKAMTGGTLPGQNFSKLFSELPTLDPNSSLTLEALVTPDKHGLTPLDNAFTWREFPKIAKELAAQGTPITKEFLMQPNRDGDPFLANGIRSNCLRTVSKLLKESGTPLTAADLLDGREPSAILQAAVAARCAPKFFTEEIWQGQSVASLGCAYKALPDEIKQQVPNYHALRASVSRQEHIGSRNH